jgi:hypothetical protein
MAYRPPLIKGPVYITIAASVRSPDFRALAISAGWIGYEPLYCTINAGVDVSNLTIANIPNGLLTIINRGRIGAEISTGFGIYTRTNISIDNAGGTIFGIGGRGGSGGALRIANTFDNSFQATGLPGTGGIGGGFSNYTPLVLLGGSPGASGSSVATGGPSSGGASPVSTGGAGGSGGAIGVSGASGQAGSATGSYTLIQTFNPSAGDPPGNYIDGNAYVTWIATGTRLGNAI